VDFVIVFYSYPIYLYLNFSGYTDVVIAISRLCGMTTMPENFNRPYLARNVQDFWTRWHMSFSTWIRDYVFTPLSKRLVAATVPGRAEAMLAVAVVLTFIIVGAWHGTTLSFVIFGLLHGFAVIVATLYGSILKRLLGSARRRAFESHRATHAVSVVACFHFVCATLALINNGLGDISRALGFFFAGAT
jgi:D-alanyl-lipoteichoic acid acyltransferase DltB (MBOAT superfamily)